MSSSQHCWSLVSLLLLLAGTNLGVLVTIPQKLVNGTVGQPVLLPVSYRLNDAPQFPLSVVWAFMNSSNVLISCTLLGCALGAGKVPHNCSSKCVPPATQCKQLELFPENGSLLLWDLQLSSAGTYIVTFRPPHQAWTIDLAVHEQPPSPWHPAGPVEPNHTRYYIIGICSSASLLLLLLLFCCVWRRGAAWQQKRRIIKVQQVSRAEEPPVESAVVREVATIYTTVGGSFEPAPPRPTPEVVYASVSSPRLQGRDPGPYHLLV